MTLKKQSECCVCSKSKVYLDTTHKKYFLFFFYETQWEPYFTFLHIMFGELHHSSGRHAGAEVNTASPFIWGIFVPPPTNHASISVNSSDRLDYESSLIS